MKASLVMFSFYLRPERSRSARPKLACKPHPPLCNSSGGKCRKLPLLCMCAGQTRTREEAAEKIATQKEVESIKHAKRKAELQSSEDWLPALAETELVWGNRKPYLVEETSSTIGPASC